MKYYADARVKFPVTDTHVYIYPVMLLFLRETEIHRLWLSNLNSGELPNIRVFPFNIYAMAKSIDFKFGTLFGWPVSII